MRAVPQSCYLIGMDLQTQVSRVDDPVLARFRAALDKLYGDRLERAVLFGSRARGDARPDSDYDVAVFLRDYTDLWNELQPLGALTTDILLETGAVISAKPFPAGKYQARTRLMGEIRREGIDILTPQAARELAAARQHLAAAKAIVGLDVGYVAGREAYIAAYHAAEAFIHDRTGSLAKTHRGLRTQFARLAQTEPQLDPGFSRFLANAYEIKSVADYGDEPESVSPDAARAIVRMAEQMIDAIAQLLEESDERPV